MRILDGIDIVNSGVGFFNRYSVCFVGSEYRHRDEIDCNTYGSKPVLNLAAVGSLHRVEGGGRVRHRVEVGRSIRCHATGGR